ncbi:MAG: hypothetical protein ABIY37_01065 [Devosia sp.]
MALVDTADHPSTISEPTVATASGTIRPFTAADAPRVAEILLWAFQKSTRVPPQGMVDYIKRLYLEIPWADPDIYARVMELPDGRISGFAGLTPLPLRMGDKRVRVGVTSSLSVDDRIGDHMTGPRLVRHMRNGAQDGVLSDRSNQAATAISRQLKSDILHSYSMDFIRLLRPAGRGVEWLSGHFRPARLLSGVATPIDRKFAARSLVSEDAHWAAPGKTRGSDSFKDVPVTLDQLLDLIPHFLERFTLRPDFERHHWQFILEDGARKASFGEFFANAVVSPSGETIGLYLYHGRKGQTAELLQAFSNPGREGVVLDKLIGHAMELGAVAIHGRSTPTFHRQLMDRHAFFYPNMWTIVYARDPEVVSHFNAGTAFFTGIAGENWIRLNGDSF